MVAYMRPLLVPAILFTLTVSTWAQSRLTERQIADAIAVGRECGDLPLLRVEAPRTDFVVFIEGPFARVAEHAAVARQMRVPFTASNVTPDMAAPDYRIWTQYTPNGQRTVAVDRVVLRPLGATQSSVVIQPIRESQRRQLTLGPIPAHGIITEVRWRWHEWIFDRLPANDFQVVLETSGGRQRYNVTKEVRERFMRVCT
jgi:hypothetical protein